MTTVICTWRRQHLLRQVLASLTELDVPAAAKWDVLVVNNDCSAETDQVIAEFASRLPVQVVHEAVLGLSNARNRAISETRSDLVGFTDDDALVDRCWLVRLLDSANLHPKAGVFGGAVQPWFPVPPDPLLAEAFPLLASGFCGTGEEPAGECGPEVTIFGANMVFRRAALEGLEFDPRLGVRGGSIGGLEETDLIERVRARGWTVVWCPGMRVRHYVDPSRMTLDYLVRFYTDRTRSHFRRLGRVEGPLVFGFPRWALAACCRQKLRQAWCRLRGDRLGELIALREYCRKKGAALECRLLARERDVARSHGG